MAPRIHQPSGTAQSDIGLRPVRKNSDIGLRPVRKNSGIGLRPVFFNYISPNRDRKGADYASSPQDGGPCH